MNRKRLLIPLALLIAAGGFVGYRILRPPPTADQFFSSGTVEATEARLGFQAPGRLEFLGVRELVRLRHEDGVALRELETRHIRFFDSGLLGDLCTVVTKLVELDASRIVMEHRFMRDRDQKMLTRGVCELGFLDVATGAPVPVPPSLLRGLAADPAQHIPRNAISSVFGGGAPVPAAAVCACCLPLPFARASARHAQSNEDNTPGLKNRFRTQRKLLRTQQEI